MVRKLTLLLCLALLVSSASPALASVTVERGPANIRSGPGTQHPVLATVPTGQVLEDTGRSGDWIQVKTPDGRQGFILSSLVRLESAAGQNSVAVPKSTINVRFGPSTNHAVIGKAATGIALRVAGISGDWLRVDFNGREGWVASWLCRVSTLDQSHFESGDLVKKVVVLRDGVRVRAGASEHFSSVATLRSGAQADFLESRNGWHRIRTAAGVLGWVDATDVRVFNVDSSHGAIYVIGDDFWEMRIAPQGRANQNVNIRQSPNTSSRILATVRKGQAFRVTGERSGWYSIQHGGVTGWVAGWLVSVEQPGGPASIRLERAPQAKTLTVRGTFPTASIMSLGPLSLGVLVTPREQVRGRLEVYAGEVGTIELGAAGVLVSFTERPSYRIVESRPGLLRLEFNSTVDSIEHMERQNSIRVATSGYPGVRATFDEAQGRLSVRLDGASLGTESRSLPARGALLRAVASQAPGAVTLDLQVVPGSQYNLRRSQNEIVIDILPKGLAGKIICIDPGHGGNDPGAIGPSGLMEKQITLEISLELKSLLEQRGATVVMTRTKDDEGVDLATRVKIVADSRADLFVSVHADSNPSRALDGTMTLFAETSLNTEQSRRFSGLVQQSLVQALGRTDRGVRSAELYICRNSPVGAALAEVVFISNPAEEQLLRDPGFKSRAAHGLAQAIRQYFGE